MTEGEQASLWNRENMRALPSASMRLTHLSQDGDDASFSQLHSSINISNLSAKDVAGTLTLLRYRQFQALNASDIVRFCMLAPDPKAFETILVWPSLLRWEMLWADGASTTFYKVP